jgi:hypothetical protein
MKYIANPVEVDAFRIVGVFGYQDEISKDGLGLKLEGGEVQQATPEMCARMTPRIGDYFVIQSDGYAYLNPKEVFERKYSPAPLNALQLGAAARAAGIVR